MELVWKESEVGQELTVGCKGDRAKSKGVKLTSTGNSIEKNFACREKCRAISFLSVLMNFKETYTVYRY